MSHFNNLSVKFLASKVSHIFEFKFTSNQKPYAVIAIHTKWAVFSLNASVRSEIWRLFKIIQRSIFDKGTTNSTKV